MKETEESTRIKKSIAEIDYGNTLHFFNNRAGKYREDNPYAVTMYQDNNPSLVEERNKAEVAKLLPLLKLNFQSKVLDLACGVGRWSDAITTEIQEYCGVDFSERLIELARKRTHEKNRVFYVGSAIEFGTILTEHHKGQYDRIILMGILMYINDWDLAAVMEQILKTAEEHTVICIREPVGIDERLTLKEFYSEELKDNYDAIYRTRDELFNVFEKTLMTAGFRITQSGFLFDEDALNNRKETAQYYFVLER